MVYNIITSNKRVVILMTKYIKLSVRNLVEFVMRSGNIDSSFMSSIRAVEGTKAHQKIQRSYGDGYRPEVFLKYTLEYEGFVIEIEGRVDGIIEKDKTAIIDEIKSTLKPLEEIHEDYNILHWAQAKCYGYIYAKEKNLKELDIQLTYFNIESEDVKKFLRKYTVEELEEFFISLIEKYLEWANLTFYWVKVRDESIGELSFPFKDYRKGQRKLAVSVYRTILDEKKIFIQAPTGIGKTISVLFPAVKSIGEGLASKVFYLTAKTITREAALNAVDIMAAKGLRIKSLVITAKEKICTNTEVKCNPEDCPCAKGHYDRVNDAIMDVFKNEDIITRDVILKYSKIHNVCPFELSLDLSLLSDLIICDYNYVFDPNVYLKRFFDVSGDDYIFLIDEAHNLVDRSREMYSAEIHKSQFLKYRKILKESHPKLSKAFLRCNNMINKLKREYLKEESFYYQKDEIDSIYPPIKRLLKELEEWLIKNKKEQYYDELLDIYFDLIRFINISELYSSRYVTYVQKADENIVVKLFCVDASYLLQDILKKGRASVFFSATLTPLKYYKHMLGGDEDDYIARFSSPFPRDNLCLLIADKVSTRYRDRNYTYMEVVDCIEKFIQQKKGNYLVFFPSYKYMEDVYCCFVERNPHINIIKQEGNMDELAREEFLNQFDSNGIPIVAFAVLGGIFSEGIDLIGDKLIGAVIVGVGLPQICFERDIIRDYFDSENGLGYEYAYMYPGMNKVLQAAGRVIRSENDRGAILLIDDRFTTVKYARLFPEEWMHFKRINGSKDIVKYLNEFWNGPQ